jgi:phage-related minor tail protein
VINELVIDRPEFNYETKLFSSNIKDLLANIEKYTGKGGEADTKEGPAKKFIVKKLRFTNGKATVGVGAAAIPVPLPEIRLDDIGTAEGGVSGSRVALVVMRDVLTNIATATASALSKDGGKATLDKAKDTAKELGNAVKDLFKKP